MARKAANRSPVRVGRVTQRLTSTGRVSGFQVEVWHDVLNEHRVLADRDEDVLQNKVDSYLAKLEEKYERYLEKAERQARKAAAESATQEAKEALRASETILRHTLTVDDRVDWESLKSRGSMTLKPRGTPGIQYHGASGRPKAVRPAERPRQPEGTDPPFLARLSVLDLLVPFLRKRKKARAQAAFEAALHRWRRESEKADREDAARRKAFQEELRSWQAEEAAFKAQQQVVNDKVEAQRRSYQEWDGSDVQPIEQHAELVLNASEYPDWIAVDFELGFNAATRTLVVEYQLPPSDSIPTLRGVAYVQSRDEIKESHIPARERDSRYESICYQIALRTVHELYEADEIGALSAIVFNGWVTSVNPATGQTGTSCIMSIQAQRDEFLALNLAEIDPKECFRTLKGVSAAKLATITAVRPILRFDTGDRRFVESREIAESVSTETNLAAMDWEDFEHLVRELFEKEFVSAGGEVKVTQASRDGGVDAIAFDPDPIRGGKYVIQAKRYTRTVDVGAVRDLYGTVQHEGANRGILVTTADYGADSVKFASDKPLTLINGAELLSLLEKHGHQARIDVQEARALQADMDR